MKYNSIVKSLFLSCSLLSYSAFAQETLVVYEDEGKANALEMAARDFEKECNCKIDVQDTVAIADHLNKVKEFISNGQKDMIPDVFGVISDRMGDALDADAITPLPMMQTDKDLYAKEALESYTNKGEIYAFPRSFEILVLYYNKDVLEYPFETFNEYMDFNNKRQSQGKLGLLARFDMFYYGFGILNAFGAKVFGKNNDGTLNPYDIQLNKAGVEKGLDFIIDYNSRYMPKELMKDGSFSPLIDLVASGQAAAIVSGPWDFFTLAKTGMNFGVAPLPKLPNGQPMRPFSGAKGYVVYKNSQHKDLAQKFLRFANQPKYALERYKKIGEIPPVKAVMEDPLITNDDFANAVVEQIKNADPMPAIKEMGEVWTPMGDEMLNAIEGKKSSKQALDDAVFTIRSHIY